MKKVSLFAIPVLLRRAPEPGGKQPVEIADVFISDGYRDLVHTPVRIAQQPCRLAQPFFLQQFRIVFPGFLTDQPGKGGQLVMQHGCRFGQAPVFVVFFHIPEHGKDDVFFGAFKLQGFRMIEQLGKQQPMVS